MNRIVYTCPYIPAEWIKAHGLKPSRILPGSTSSGQNVETAEGICHYLRETLDWVVGDTDSGGVIISTVCDQMRRAPDLLQLHTDKPVFLFNVPATWQTVGPHRLYISELARLSLFLVGLDGTKPSDALLMEIMQQYDNDRKALRESAGYLHDRQFSEAIVGFNYTGSLPERPSVPLNHSGIPVALIGGPLSRQDFQVFDLIDAAGGTVILDGTGTGERTLPRQFDLQAMREDPLGELADAYFGAIPDVFRRPNSELYIWMKEEIEKRGVRGIVFIRNVWCDIWHGEMERMRDWLDLPMLAIDLDGEELGPRDKTRIEAFMEMLK